MLIKKTFYFKLMRIDIDVMTEYAVLLPTIGISKMQNKYFGITVEFLWLWFGIGLAFWRGVK